MSGVVGSQEWACVAHAQLKPSILLGAATAATAAVVGDEDDGAAT